VPLGNVEQGTTGSGSVTPETRQPQLDEYPLGGGSGASGTGDGTGQPGARRGTRNYGGGVPRGREATSGATTDTRRASNEPDPKSVKACMDIWEPATHMSKQEWRATCRRTLRSTPIDVLGTP
jgi:hypothetical protein